TEGRTFYRTAPLRDTVPWAGTRAPQRRPTRYPDRRIDPREATMIRLRVSTLALALLSASATAAVAPEDYVQRVANDYRAAMQQQDYDQDGAVTREEARTNLLLSGAFNAI